MSSLKEISIAVRAENRSSMVFRSVGSDLLMLAQSFGIMDSATGRAAHAALTMMHLMTSMVGILNAYSGAAEDRKSVV